MLRIDVPPWKSVLYFFYLISLILISFLKKNNWKIGNNFNFCILERNQAGSKKEVLYRYSKGADTSEPQGKQQFLRELL